MNTLLLNYLYPTSMVAFPTLKAIHERRDGHSAFGSSKTKLRVRVLSREAFCHMERARKREREIEGWRSE